jgi:hypothetical protein
MKRLTQDSKYNAYDTNNDGVVTDEELAMAEEMIMLENEDKKQDAQRNMAWFALAGMLLYPFSVVLATWLGLDQAAKILGDMAATYFVSVAAIVAAFYGKEAFVARRDQNDNPPSQYPRYVRRVEYESAPAPEMKSRPFRGTPLPKQEQEEL